METNNSIYNNFIKRILDIILALIVLILLSPIYLILILTLYIMQGRPIFFAQTRLGLNGKKFKMYKFRTMKLTREKIDLNATTENEITTLGQILRKMGLDELPQIFNILKGDMSFIGPRPWIPEIYDYLPDEAKKRLKVLPGLSGYAQVNDRNGITVNQKIKLDLFYINNSSLYMDLYIFLKTFYCIFSYKHADRSEQELVKEIKGLQYQKEEGEIEMMNSPELISVIVPVYKVEKYLEKCIKSILEQTYSNLEIILVDDGSPDKCGEICDEFKKHDSRIKVIHKANGGLSDARNVGIMNSTGAYITFVDSDDYIDDCYIEVLYNTLVSNNADMSIVSHRVLNNEKCIDKSTNEQFCGNSKLILEKILYNDGVDIATWGKLYKSKLFNQVNFPKGRIYEDAATIYKLVDLCDKIAVCSKAVYNYIFKKDSITNEEFSEKNLDIIISTKEMTDFIRNKYPDLEGACNQRMMYAYLSALTQLVRSKDKKDKKFEKQLLTYIRNNKNPVLKDPRTPIKCRIGIYSSLLGLGFYRFVLKCYSKI